MNTKPDAISVLCYGDSNTWGQKPDKTGRYPSNVRWTGVLQETLGEDFYVIEEGLSSRTTDLDYKKPGRNGKTYLVPCLASHNPIDVVVLMLGTNDLKVEFDRSEEEVGSAIAGLVGDIKQYAWNKKSVPPQIVLISPIFLDSTAPRFEEFYNGIYDETSSEKSRGLAEHIKKVADENDCYFLDAHEVSEPGIDGIHFNESSHPALGKRIAQCIREIKL